MVSDMNHTTSNKGIKVMKLTQDESTNHRLLSVVCR